MTQQAVSPILPGRRFEMHKRYGSREELVEEFHRCGRKVDFGCGYNKPEGYIGIDNFVGAAAQHPNEKDAPDIVLDLMEGSPFADGSCAEVRMSHFLEHCSDVDTMIQEAHRVLEPTGLLRVVLPYANSAEGMYPGHTVFFTEKWFHLNLTFNRHFVIAEERFQPSDDWERAPDSLKGLIPFEHARKFLFNVCNEMTLLCRPKKPIAGSPGGGG